MKRHLLARLVLCGLLAFASPGWSLTINGGAINVGSQDPLHSPNGSALLPNSGDLTEVTWVNSVLGTTFTVPDMTKYDFVGPATAVDGNPGIVAFALADEPSWFFIKIGTGNLPPGTPDHYLFDNLAALDWGVVALSALNITEVGRFSHVGEFGGTNGVPEPATMLLLGSGLIGLVGLRRKFRK